MYLKNHQIEPLHTNQYDSADGWGKGGTYRYGIWLPNNEHSTGVAQADTWQGPNYAVQCNLAWHMRELAGVYQKSKLQHALSYIGLRGYWGQNPKSIIASTLAHFPSVSTLRQKVDELNNQLPEKHQLPEFVEYEKDEYPARTFLENLAQGKVMVAASRGASKEKDGINAGSAAHDMSFHVPYWLATTPAIRERLQIRARKALADTPPGAKEPNSFFPTLPVGIVMDDIDRGISGLGMYDVVTSDYGAASNEFYAALDTNAYQGRWMVDEVREHIAYLNTHVPEISLAS